MIALNECYSLRNARDIRKNNCVIVPNGFIRIEIMLIQSHCYKNEKKVTKKNSSTIPLGNTKVTSYSVSVFFFCFSILFLFVRNADFYHCNFDALNEKYAWKFQVGIMEHRLKSDRVFFSVFPKRNSMYMLVTFSYISWCFVLRFVSVRTSSKLKASAKQNSCNSSKETKCAQNVIQCVILDAKKLYQSGLKRR